MWKVGLGAAVLILVIDRALKQMAVSSFGTAAININEQYFFLIDVGKPYSQWLSLALLCVATGVAVFLWRSFGGIYKKYALTALVLFLGGGMSNAVDRFLYGGVIDMIPLFSLSYFNIADAAILGGASIFIFIVWRQKYIQERL